MSNTINETEKAALLALDNAGIPYIRLTHAGAYTMELCKGIGLEYGARHCKNLFLTNRQGNRFFLMLMDADAAFRTADISKKLGVARLSFGAAEQLHNVLGLEQGSVSIMGLINECAMREYAAGRLNIVIDRSIIEQKSICVHPNVNNSSLVLDVSDMLRFISARGYDYSIIDT